MHVFEGLRLQRLQWLGIFLFLQLSACTCERSKKSSVDLSKPPAPLQVQKPPADVHASVFPLVGSTSENAVVLVAASESSLCTQARAKFGKDSHVLCSQAAPQELGKELKHALRFLKETYPRHVGGPPVLLLSAPSHAEASWYLVLSEPGFFAHASLEGLKPHVLTSTTLEALQRGGARTLVLNAEEDERLKFLKNIAKRHGLMVHTLKSTPDSRETALQLLASARSSSRPASP